MYAVVAGPVTHGQGIEHPALGFLPRAAHQFCQGGCAFARVPVEKNVDWFAPGNVLSVLPGDARSPLAE